MLDLQAFKQAMQDAARQTRLQEAAARERAAVAQRERDLFARSVGPVLPVYAAARASASRPRAEPLPRQRALDDAAVLREAISDEFDVESLLDTDDALSWRRDGIGHEVVRQLRRGVWVTQAHLDLHGLRREAARERLGDFMHEAVRCGLRCVRIVHGKGLGSPGRTPVLKSKVKTWLVQNNDVIAFAHARASDGGHGAVVVLLRA